MKLVTLFVMSVTLDKRVSPLLAVVTFKAAVRVPLTIPVYRLLEERVKLPVAALPGPRVVTMPVGLAPAVRLVVLPLRSTHLVRNPELLNEATWLVPWSVRVQPPVTLTRSTLNVAGDT